MTKKIECFSSYSILNFEFVWIFVKINIIEIVKNNNEYKFILQRYIDFNS